MAGSETWVVGKSCSNQRIGAIATGDAPGVTAVALALLAAWGVLLVTRGRLRRIVAVLAAMLSLGLVAAVVLGVGSAQDGVRESVESFGLDCQELDLGSWFWAAVAALPFAVLPAVAAVRLVSGWPEMGRRYDAPAEAAPEPAKSPDEQENLELWKAMDEGRDPTA